jgi:4-amino-4-deoxy-L-arabinose transferase-like glycosyltransferase
VPTRSPRIAVIVIILAAVFATLASIAIAFGSAPLQTADETAHLDYAIELWHGHLPVFQNGLQIHPPFGQIPPVQWVSQHPPLFYAILAPVVGPLWDAGHLWGAVVAGRSINSVIAGLTVLAIAWAASRVVPKRPEVAALAAVIASGCGMFLLVGGAVYNDLPNVAFAALAIGVGAMALRRGLSWHVVVLGALVTAGGMLSRLSFAAFVVAVIAAFLLAPWSRTGFWRGIVGHLVAVVSVILAPALAAGWFFLRNKRLTGSISGSHPKWAEEHIGRSTHSLSEIALSKSFWESSFALYRGHLAPTSWQQWVLLFAPLVLAIVVGVIALVRRRLRFSVGGLFVVLMLVGLFIIVTAAQIDYSMGGGAENSRYFLPLLPVLAIPMAIGLSGLGRVIAPIVSGAWLVLAGVVWALIPNVTSQVSNSSHGLELTRLFFGLALVALVATVAVTVLLLVRRGPVAPPADDAPVGETTGGDAPVVRGTTRADW